MLPPRETDRQTKRQTGERTVRQYVMHGVLIFLINGDIALQLCMLITPVNELLLQV